MSLENEIKKLTETITLLISKLDHVGQPVVVAEVPVVKQEPVKVEERIKNNKIINNPSIGFKFETDAEVKPEVAVDMPAPPSFTSTTSVSAQPAAPFSNAEEVYNYALASYKALGPHKGLGIQTILTKMGHQSFNQIKPEQYYEFYKQVEALKNE